MVSSHVRIANGFWGGQNHLEVSSLAAEYRSREIQPKKVWQKNGRVVAE